MLNPSMRQIPSARPRQRVTPELYPRGAPITEERIVNAMKVLAHIMISRPDGEVLSPLFERLERELEGVRERRRPVERARRFLESFTIDARSALLPKGE